MFNGSIVSNRRKNMPSWWAHASIPVKRQPPGWWRVCSTTSPATRLWRKSCATNSSSRSSRCWIRTVWSSATVGVRWPPRTWTVSIARWFVKRIRRFGTRRRWSNGWRTTVACWCTAICMRTRGSIMCLSTAVRTRIEGTRSCWSKCFRWCCIRMWRIRWGGVFDRSIHATIYSCWSFSSASRAAISRCNAARKELGVSSSGCLALQTATPWRRRLVVPRWVDANSRTSQLW